MTIWAGEIKELDKLYESFKGQLPDIVKELEQLIRTQDANVVMLYSRRCLEVIITDLCQCELNRPRKTEPLKGIIDKLNSEEKVPSHIITSMHSLNSMSTYGTHPKDFVPEQVKPVLNNLAIIIKWYLKYKDFKLVSKIKVEKEEKQIENTKHTLLTKRKLVSGAIIIGAILVIVLVYSKVFQTGKTKVERDPNGRISIVVNTFNNLTGDMKLNYWGLGIQELLINNLGNSHELSVQNSQTIYEVYESMGQTKNASVIPSLSREAAMKLKASTYITGSYQKTGNKIIMLVKLIDTQNDEVLWTNKIEGSPNSNYADLTDSLSLQVKNFLEIKSLKQKTSLEFREAFSNSPEAYRIYVKGMNSFMNADYISAIQSFKEALEIDSTFTLAAFYLANAYNSFGGDQNNRQAAKWTQRAFRGKERLPENYQHWVESWEAYYITKNTQENLTSQSTLEKSEIKSRYYWFDVGSGYSIQGMYDKAVKLFEKVESINSEWGDDWKFLGYYKEYGKACHFTGNHKKESEIFETGLKVFPDNIYLLFGQARCAISESDTVKGTEFIRKLLEAAKGLGYTKIQIESGYGFLYQDANSLDKAEMHFRNAFLLNPSNPLLMNDLASFLIRYDRNIDEGMKLIKRALEILPGRGSFLMTQGSGYYKQGKFKEAYSILNVAKDSILTWNAELNKQILDAKKALDNQESRRK
jgi:tetratricopeptide (TPR) repeat protein